MSEPILPLARSLNGDRLYRVNAQARLLRTLPVAYNDLNLDCFLPPDIPMWTEGVFYRAGDIVYGRYDDGPQETYVDHIWECKLDHLATVETQPVESTTLRWQMLGATPSARGTSWHGFLPFKYPPCGTLVGLGKYDGINRTPTGVLATIEGIVPPKPRYSDFSNQWLFDINGTYVLPLGLDPFIISGLTSDAQVACYFKFDGLWNGQCHDLKKNLHIEMHSSSVDDDWWTWGSVFCGETDVTKCPTSYTIKNLLPDTPSEAWTQPFEEDPNYVAWRESLKPAEALCGEVIGHWGGLGNITVQGFTEYCWITFDMFDVDYSSDGRSAHCTWRFALNDRTGKIAILKSNVGCDFYQQELHGQIVGGSLETLLPGTDGYFEKNISDVPLTTDFGVTNIRAYGNRYHGTGQYFGTVNP